MTVRELIDELERYDEELGISLVFNILDENGNGKSYECSLEEVEENQGEVNLIVYI